MTSARKPNVIIVTTDQQRYDSVGINGSGFMNTPNQDRIGREGAVFERAYCPNTVCTPSRASLMTGLHLSRHGAYNIGTQAVDMALFMSRLLTDNGYRTHHIGKAHWYPWGTENPETREPSVDGAPFRNFAGFETAEVCIGHAEWGVQGHYRRWILNQGYDPKAFTVSRLFEGDMNGTGDWTMPTKLHSGTWIAECALDFLRSHDRSQPFFLNLGFQDPHHPHIVPYDFQDRVDPNAVPYPEMPDETERAGFAEHIPYFHRGGIGSTRFVGRFEVGGNGNHSAWEPYFRNEEKGRMTRAYYYSMVQLYDRQLGMILDALDRLRYTDDTLIIVTTDHGEMLGDHAIGQKGPMIYEGVTHIPMLVRYPQQIQPCRVKECVSLVDILPTVLDYTGLCDPVRRDGVSLKPLLESAGEPWQRDGVRIEYKEEPDRIRFKCWVTQEWKLAIYGGETFGELYDLKNDPGETCNLYREAAYADVKIRLMQEMLADLERSEPLSERPTRV